MIIFLQFIKIWKKMFTVPISGHIESHLRSAREMLGGNQKSNWILMVRCQIKSQITKGIHMKWNMQVDNLQKVTFVPHLTGFLAQQYSYIEFSAVQFLFKFLTQMVNKRDFLKIINLYQRSKSGIWTGVLMSLHYWRASKQINRDPHTWLSSVNVLSNIKTWCSAT